MSFFNIKYKKLSDEELMVSLKQGKEKAFVELYERYKKKMHFFFYKMLFQDSSKADDFLQDLFIKIIEKPHLYSEGNKFSTWIYSIASNMCKNEFRRISIRKEVKSNETIIEFHREEESITDSFDKSIIENCLKEEIELLDQEHKEIFILRFQEELSIKEISQIVNCPEGTVKSRIFYTVKKLSKKLKAYQA